MRSLWLISLAALLVVGLGRAAGARDRGSPAVSRAAASGARAARHTVLLYASDWTGPTEPFAFNPATKATLGQLTLGTAPGCDLEHIARPILPCGFSDPLPSPNGRWLLYRGTERGLGERGSLWLAAADGSGARELPFTELSQFPYGSNFGAVWSPDSRAIAYYAQCACDQAGLHILRVGSGANDDRLVYSDHSLDGAIAWSRNGIAFSGWGVDSPPMLYHNGKVRSLSSVRGIKLSWSPDGNLLAVWESTGLPYQQGKVLVTDRRGKVKLALSATWAQSCLGRLVARWPPASRRSPARHCPRRSAIASKTPATHDPGFGLTWSPDSRTLAYIQGALGENVESDNSNDLRAQTGDLRTVTLSGQVRTIVAADHAYEGRIVAAAWTRPAAPISYRPAEPAPPSRVAPSGLLADGPVVALAADGDRVAYIACEEVSVWTPAAGTLTAVSRLGSRAGIGADTSCKYHYPVLFDGLALAADRVAWGWMAQSATTWWWRLHAAASASPAQPGLFAEGNVSPFGDWQAEGDLVGGGGFLGFSEWQEECASRPCESHPIVTTAQTIKRIDGVDCPCAAIASSPGPVIAFDVESGRIAAGGSNATVILDAQGRELLSTPVSPLAAHDRSEV